MDEPLDILSKYHGFYRCPAPNCEEREDILTALVRGRDGRQRAVWGCPEHLPSEVLFVINHLRLRPPL